MEDLTNTSQNNDSYDTNTCETILDTAKSIHNEELERFNQAETKTSIALALLGIIFIAYINYLSNFTLVNNEISYLIYTFFFKFIIFISFTLSTIFFLNSIKTSNYEQISIENIINTDFIKLNGNIVKLKIATTYKDAIKQNKFKIEQKMKYYNCGLKFLFIGFIIFIVHFIIEEVIKYVH